MSVYFDGRFKFLPILLGHVSQNRTLFARNISTVYRYPVAIRFKNLITRLVEGELDEMSDSSKLVPGTAQYVAGGLYSALVHWAAQTESSLSRDEGHREHIRGRVTGMLKKDPTLLFVGTVRPLFLNGRILTILSRLRCW